MALNIFVARQKNESLKALGIIWVNLVLCIATLLAIASAYWGFNKGTPITGLLFSVWLFLGGIFYVSVRHPFKTLNHRFQTTIPAIALLSLIVGIVLVKTGTAI